MMNNKDLRNYGLNLFGAFLTAIQTEHLFQIISLILTCVATFLSIAFTIWKWWKKAYEDKKITLDEIKELEFELLKKNEENKK